MDLQISLIRKFLRELLYPLIKEAVIDALKEHSKASQFEVNSPEEIFLNAQESANYIGDALQTFYGRTSRGELQTYGSGKKILCKKSDLQAWLEKKRTKSSNKIENEINEFLTKKSRKARSLKLKSK